MKVGQSHIAWFFLRETYSGCILYLFIKQVIVLCFLLPEFDKFLEERAKAAEMAPGLPTPPSSNPAAAQETHSRKKPDRPEDSLFAM